MGQVVVTELVIDSAKAVDGARQYSDAMDRAQSAMQRNLGPMSDAIAEVRDGIAGMGQAATNIIPSVGQLAVGIGAAGAAVLAMSALVKEFTRGLADMGQAARRAGLDVESFQKLQFGASLEGIANKDFASGVEKMASRLNDASRNENDLSKLLDANNVKFKDANGTLISTNALLEKSRDLISRAANEQDKIKMAEMLGLTKEWVPFLDKSAEAFADTQKEATALGLVISGDIIKKAAEFDREWRKSSEVFSVYMKAQLAELLPELQVLIDKAKEIINLLPALPQLKLQLFAPGDPIKDFIDQGIQKAQNFMSLFDSTLTDAERTNLAISQTNGTLNAQQKATSEIAAAWKEVDTNAAAAWTTILKGISATSASVAKAIPNFNPSNVPAKDTTETRDAWDRAVTSIDKHIGRLAADTLAVGQTVAAHDQLRAEFQLLEAAKISDKNVTDAQIAQYTVLRASMGSQQALVAAGINLNTDDAAAFDRVTAAIAAASQANTIAIALDQARFDAKTALLGPLEKEIALLEKRNGINPQTKEIEDLKRLTEVEKAAQEAGIKFAQTLAQGLFDAKAGTDSVSKGFEALSKSLASTAIRDLLSGKFEQAAVSAISAVVTWVASLVSHASDLKGTIDTLDRLNQLRLRSVNATSDSTMLSGSLGTFDAGKRVANDNRKPPTSKPVETEKAA
jgi:hypothetical protein